MRTTRRGMLTAALAGLASTVALAASPETARAQDGWWDWTLRELSVRVGFGTPAPHYVPDVIVVPAPRYRETRRKRGGGRGPAFCRSGAGHPVFGRRWCLDKGFGLGGSAYREYGAVRWERRSAWHRDLPRHRQRYRPGTLGRRELVGVLGPAVYSRLDGMSGRMGGRQPLTGRWIRPAGGTSLVLQIRSGRFAVAELTDFGPDGWFDVLLVASR